MDSNRLLWSDIQIKPDKVLNHRGLASVEFDQSARECKCRRLGDKPMIVEVMTDVCGGILSVREPPVAIIRAEKGGKHVKYARLVRYNPAIWDWKDALDNQRIPEMTGLASNAASASVSLENVFANVWPGCRWTTASLRN